MCIITLPSWLLNNRRINYLINVIATHLCSCFLYWNDPYRRLLPLYLFLVYNWFGWHLCLLLVQYFSHDVLTGV